MSDNTRHSAFYVQQHARAQETIQRLRAEVSSLRAFVEMVAWGEWMEYEDGGCLFGDVIDRRLAERVRDQARAVIEGEREEAA